MPFAIGETIEAVGNETSQDTSQPLIHVVKKSSVKPIERNILIPDIINDIRHDSINKNKTFSKRRGIINIKRLK